MASTTTPVVRNLMQALGLSLLVTGCVSNKAIQTVQPGDDAKSCGQLQNELASLGVEFEEAKDDSGVTGKNVGMAILFWPGIIVNEVRASKNQDSIDARVTHLSRIYNSKCLEAVGSDKQGERTLQDRLIELKELREEGLLSEEEYQAARQKVLNNFK